jgi:hypothetical protein
MTRAANGLVTLLGGKEAMIGSPLINELLADQEFIEAYVAKRSRAAAESVAQAAAHRHILTVLETRFGAVPPDLAGQIQSVTDEDGLTDLVRKASSCPDLKAF